MESYIYTLNGPVLYAMIPFRIANHKMQVETGRWNQIDFPDRKCQLCDKNDLEDEYHYLFSCPYFRNQRDILYRSALQQCTEHIKFKELLQIKDTEKLVKLGKYMRIIMQALI